MSETAADIKERRLALDLGRNIAASVAARALDAGLLLNAPRPNLLRFMPALNVSRDDTETMLAMLDDVITQVMRGDRG